jgi:hypothetical protein
MLLQGNFTAFICSMLKYPLHKFPIQTMGAKKTMYFINAFLFHDVDVYIVLISLQMFCKGQILGNLVQCFSWIICPPHSNNNRMFIVMDINQ